jgi:putative N6-adenine-specific DNA methylase
LNFHVNDDSCSLALDSSGESLHIRGYRIDGHVAPLNEVLAAGMVLLTGWNGKSDFYDLMCGSGTILIEAAMIAYNIKPGVFRSNYAFEKWKDFDMDLFESVYDQFEETKFPYKIYGSDYSAKTVSLARTNIKNALLDKRIEVNTKSFFDYKFDRWGTLIMNPPYGERMGGNNLNSFYKRIGDKLKKDFTNWHVWILSSNKEALKNIGLRTSRRYTLFNGSLECKFNKYELYTGTKKKKKLQKTEK